MTASNEHRGNVERPRRIDSRTMMCPRLHQTPHFLTCDPTTRFYTVPLSNETIVNNIAHAKANVTQRNILATLPTLTLRLSKKL